MGIMFFKDHKILSIDNQLANIVQTIEDKSFANDSVRIQNIKLEPSNNQMYMDMDISVSILGEKEIKLNTKTVFTPELTGEGVYLSNFKLINVNYWDSSTNEFKAVKGNPVMERLVPNIQNELVEKFKEQPIYVYNWDKTDIKQKILSLLFKYLKAEIKDSKIDIYIR